MADEDERPESVGAHLKSVATGLEEVRTEVGGLRTEVGELRTDVGGLRTEVDVLRTDVGGLRTEVDVLRTDVGGLRTEVHTVRVLCETNADDIRKVAEVQVHHGHRLDDIARALEPLAELHALVRMAVPDHERRIKALEAHAGIRKAT